MGRKPKDPVNQDTDRPESKNNVNKIVLWRDEAKINELKKKLNEILPFAEKVVKCYHKLPFASDQVGFYDILSNTTAKAQNHLKNTLPDKVEISGLSVNKAKVLSMGLLEVEGLSDFTKALESFNDIGGNAYQQYFKHSEKTVIIDPLAWQEFEDRNTIAAITPDEIEIFNKMDHFLNEIHEFSSFIKKHGINIHPVPLGPIYPVMIAKLDLQNKMIVNHTVFASIAKKLRNRNN
jgi:hypothetical protein